MGEGRGAPVLLPSSTVFVARGVCVRSPRRFLLVSHATEYDLPQLVVNLITCGVLVVAKLPEMMFVRILGRKPEAKD